MNFWQLNEKRLPKYRKDYAKFKRMDTVNTRLVDVNRRMCTETELENPVIFVVGCPRSGTTLATQLIAKHLDVNFINNEVARFWKAPLVGAGLFGLGGEVDLESELGRTGNIHEFGYFWRYMLRVECFDDLFEYTPRKELKQTLATLTKEKPLVMKGLYPMYHIEALTELLGNVVWVHVRRDGDEVFSSLLDSRYKMYGSYDEWFSMPPKEWDKYDNPRMQVEQQYYEIISMIDADYSIEYNSLCKTPDVFAKMINCSMAIDNFWKVYVKTCV